MGVGAMSHRGVMFPQLTAGTRHGTAERGSLPSARYRTGSRATQERRDRERDREHPRARSADPTSPVFVRFNAAGPEETLDWIGALEAVQERLTSLETYQRKHAQSMAEIVASNAAMSTDMGKYKTYVENRFMNIETVMTGKVETVERDACHDAWLH